jgi:hypothetical protein
MLETQKKSEIIKHVLYVLAISRTQLLLHERMSNLRNEQEISGTRVTQGTKGIFTRHIRYAV